MAALKIGRKVLGICSTNCYFIYEEGSNQVIVVDPADKGEAIYNDLEKAGFEVAGIILTHAHFDHIMGLKRLQQLTGAKCYACAEEQFVCETPSANLSESFLRREYTIQPDVYVKDYEKITIGSMTCQLIHTPGHTCGSCCYYFEDAKLLISGDTLFQGSVGRTDFETGSMSQIVRSIKEKLFVLPDDVVVFPGHGERTSIGEEKMENPFCQ